MSEIFGKRFQNQISFLKERGKRVLTDAVRMQERTLT
jgi:hypothetical protein